MISLLAGSIPDVHLDLASTSDLDSLAQATRINRTNLLVVEVTSTETESQGGLSHTRYTLSPERYIPSPSTTILKVPNFFSILNII